VLSQTALSAPRFLTDLNSTRILAQVAKCLKPIVAGLLVCSHISEVSMKSNDIPASSAHILLGLLQQECVVETLDLRSNKLGNAGVTTLATKLSRNRRIVKLVLFDNGISKDGGIALFMALRSNNTLSSLDLSQNEIGLPETLEHLKRLLICNSTIENLFLWNVGIQDHGAIILGEGVAENESLKRLELRNNSLSAIGLMALSHGIKVNAIVYKVLLDVPDEPDKVRVSSRPYISRTCPPLCAKPRC
jgi:Ran GTPase-activating protein (RanGAP) involved in mRNA processing and transport